MYDDDLRIPMPAGAALTGYADDIGLTVCADTVGALNYAANTALRRIDRWMMENYLELAPQKTEAVLLKGPRKTEAIRFGIRGEVVTLSRSLKYLGIRIDDRGTFGRHVEMIVEKAGIRTKALSRIMPNIGGPSATKRKVFVGVIHSTLLSGASIWCSVLRIERYRRMLESAQRKALLRAVMAYRTVSSRALQIISGIPPIELLVEKRAASRYGGTLADPHPFLAPPLGHAQSVPPPLGHAQPVPPRLSSPTTLSCAFCFSSVMRGGGKHGTRWWKNTEEAGKPWNTDGSVDEDAVVFQAPTCRTL